MAKVTLWSKSCYSLSSFPVLMSRPRFKDSVGENKGWIMNIELKNWKRRRKKTTATTACLPAVYKRLLLSWFPQLIPISLLPLIFFMTTQRWVGWVQRSFTMWWRCSTKCTAPSKRSTCNDDNNYKTIMMKNTRRRKWIMVFSGSFKTSLEVTLAKKLNTFHSIWESIEMGEIIFAQNWFLFRWQRFAVTSPIHKYWRWGSKKQTSWPCQS